MGLTTDNKLFVFGVRHHGPGSARSLKGSLEWFRPDAILVEGPPDADGLIELAAHEDMKPPVALLVYVPDEPQRAVFYPFAVFSPEWVAIRHGLKAGVPVRFMDLPQAHRLVMLDGEPRVPDGSADAQRAHADSDLQSDPLGQLAAIAGFPDSERWWDHMVESRRGGRASVFEAIADAMAALRADDAAPKSAKLEEQREAFMRKSIRAAVQEGFERIAVVCGAWHAPALAEPNKRGQASQDEAILKGLPKIKTAVAWTPWSYDRLSFRSGYGAGVDSPAYYHLLWTHDKDPAIQWMTRVARLMRDQDIDASSAHVIAAVRLAETLAALRGRPLPGLEELDEAALTVMCFGSEAPMQLIRRRLVIGDRLGGVPDEAPLTPLQQDLKRVQKKLRLPESADEKDYDLDLRKPADLERSRLLHRLGLLQIPWGEQRTQSGKKGTFHEFWRLQWRPEFVVNLIESAKWGNTVERAAGAYTENMSRSATTLLALTELLDDALLADLPDAVSALMFAIRNQAAVGHDVRQLMAVLPALARLSRYGSVRRTDVEMILDVVDGLVARICVGLPTTAASLNDEAARELFGQMVAATDAVNVLQNPDHRKSWNAALERLAEQRGLHALIVGGSVRILFDGRAWDRDRVAQSLSLALSIGNEPAQSAAWLEGFLSGSGLLLIHDETIWGLIDEWVCGLKAEPFLNVLPLVRRTFSTFPAAERRQMGERVRRGGIAAHMEAEHAEFDYERANAVLPVLAKILGVEARS